MAWTEAAKRAFVEYHEFNPVFATYAWVMLPYQLQQLLIAAEDHLHTKLVGKCKDCGHIYPFTYEEGSIVCPKCNSTALAYAYQSSGTDDHDETLEFMRSQLGEQALSEGDILDINELERLHKLEDKRQ